VFDNEGLIFVFKKKRITEKCFRLRRVVRTIFLYKYLYRCTVARKVGINCPLETLFGHLVVALRSLSQNALNSATTRTKYRDQSEYGDRLITSNRIPCLSRCKLTQPVRAITETIVIVAIGLISLYATCPTIPPPRPVGSVTRTTPNVRASFNRSASITRGKRHDNCSVRTEIRKNSRAENRTGNRQLHFRNGFLLRANMRNRVRIWYERKMLWTPLHFVVCIPFYCTRLYFGRRNIIISIARTTQKSRNDFRNFRKGRRNTID